ncbi:MAG: class II histone deacetylase [Gaiellales bacterium]
MSQPTLDAFWHDDVLLHETGSGVFEHPPSPLIEVSELHPENDVRLRNIRSILTNGPLAGNVRWRDGRHAEQRDLEAVHDPDYVESVRAFCAGGGGVLAWSTVVVPGSWSAALAAAGTAMRATEAVLDRECAVSYALVRPPGHHAQPAMTDGYCLFNNVALCCELALRRGVERVAVIDWDVHHGNGTQECFYHRDDVLTVSLHMPHGSWGPAHPQTGSALEAGLGDGAGYNVNVELPYGTGDAGYADAMRQVVVPIVDAFRPQLLLIAAGQDASQFDPNGRQCVSMRGFRALGGIARELAERHGDGRLVMVQEGGYGRSYSAFCQHAVIEGVLGLEPALSDPMAFLPDDPARARAGIDAARGVMSKYWTL